MRIGLVGTGLMGREHIRNLALIDGAALVAMADPVADSLAAARQTLGAEASRVATFETVEAMLAEAALDAVIVAAPNHTHRAVLEPLLGTGLHVLCEKPLATTVADARAIEARAARRRGIFWVGMEYRYMPPVAAFIRAIEANAVGRLRRLALHEHRFPFLPKVGDWNRFSRNTGGTMVEKCCHFFDLMRLILKAEPVRVFCSGAMDVNHRAERYDGAVPDIVDNAFAVVEFAGGARAMLDLCMFAEGSEEQELLVAIGDEAKLEVGIPSGMVTRSPRVPPGRPKPIERHRVAVEPALLEAGAHHGATFFQLQAFLEACAGRRPVEVTTADGTWAVRMGVAAELSAAEHRAVMLDEVG